MNLAWLARFDDEEDETNRIPKESSKVAAIRLLTNGHILAAEWVRLIMRGSSIFFRFCSHTFLSRWDGSLERLL